MPYISVRGVEHYYEWIKTSQPHTHSSKPVMVFVHGWAGSGRYWQSTAEALASDFDCLLYDMRGFGRSTRLVQPPPVFSYELEEYAEDLAAFLAALELPSVYINAHSMGASVVTLFLNRYPQQVKKAILTCSGIFEYDEQSFTTFHKFGGYVVKFRPKWLGKIPLMHRFFMARFLHRSIPSPLSQAFLEDFLLADYAAALGTIFTSVSQKAAEMMPQEFAKLSVPVLLVAGEYDKIIPAAMGQMAASLSPYVEFALVPQTAHFPMLEDSSMYLKTVQAFLAKD
ncbi:alpha/beta hydrolase [Kamptonema cortianum]|uniref:Alpha/beta hydrolase n=1 Tax=Geitlerinema calcuttense NRMC-F 0142 TaxID=2922238 RepID=A0ABT7M053_9CYAN|nr:alpha/beta hydrolase [Geitlerinema calcuttense]MDK3155574.1 alpha/beta hydrolase [Kamptonema cortianum]MDL5056720.1 alpha/beta hydrolase [Geitlerinema calcuttense NRMC-F 0142]